MEIVDPRVDPRLVPSGSKAVVIAEHQKKYRDLPSVRAPDGQVITRWSLTDDERRAIVQGEDIYVHASESRRDQSAVCHRRAGELEEQMTEQTLPRCPDCWKTEHVFCHAGNEYRCSNCHSRFDGKGERMHEWQFYANGSFCRRCGAGIGTPYSCR